MFCVAGLMRSLNTRPKTGIVASPEGNLGREAALSQPHFVAVAQGSGGAKSAPLTVLPRTQLPCSVWAGQLHLPGLLPG